MAVNDDVWDLRHPGEAMRMPLAIPVFEPLPTQVMALAALLILAASVGASAQVEEARELAGILELVAKALETLVEDGCIVWRLEVDSLVLGGSYTTAIELDAGTTFIIMGIGGPAIADLDIRVYAASGAEIAWDELDDDVPIVMFAPSVTGRHTINASAESFVRGYDPFSDYYFAIIVSEKV
jgi:hypothetical protein